jgi:glycosyltransferase involved in cell wall biosynthesis
MKISVILAVFNGEAYLDRSINSFLEQDYTNKELIIVDGKSTDNSHKIIAKFQKKYPKIIKWIKEKDSGISDARNIAIKNASGDLIGNLGVDDVLCKDLFKQLEYYDAQNPYYDVIYFDSQLISKEASYVKRSAHIPANYRNLCKYSPIASGECFYYKKDILEKFKFNPKNKHTMDYELNMAIAKEKKSFYGVGIIGVINISDGSNVSAKATQIQRLENIAIQLKYARNFMQKFRAILRNRKLFRNNFLKLIKIKNNL